MIIPASNLKIAVVAIAKNEDNSIKEWIDYHIKLGFDDIILYQNDWKCKYKHNNLKLYTVKGPGKQMTCYNKFIHNLAGLYDWAAFIDVDEFIVLKKHSTIKQFIQQYSNPYAICINWVLFGSGAQKDIIQESVLKRFVKRSYRPDMHIKTLLNLHSGAHMMNPHHASIISYDTSFNKIKGSFNNNGPVDIIQVNHYYYKSYSEWKIKCERGRPDGYGPRELDEWNINIDKYSDVEDTLARDFLYGTKNEQ